LASKKKKKKKKIPFELDALDGGGEPSAQADSPSDTPIKADKENMEPDDGRPTEANCVSLFVYVAYFVLQTRWISSWPARKNARRRSST
jgi:hypothetical protein